MKVLQVNRKSAIISGSQLACLDRMPAVNLTAGCAHNCIYCYARGYSTYPGESTVVLYKNTLEKFRTELARKRTRPGAVYFSPSSDVFQPVPEVLEMGHSMFEFLFSRGIGVAFLTKGIIPEKTVKLLTENADMVRAQVGIITMDDDIRRIFEPGAGDIGSRLAQMKRLVDGGIDTEARLIPVLPGVTDPPDSLERLFRAVSETGIKRAAVSTLFLRPAIAESMKRLCPDKLLIREMLARYRSSSRIPVRAENSSVYPLPRSEREEIYRRMRHAAGKFGLEISVCGCMNPDIGGACNIAGKWAAKPAQPALFV